MDTERTLGASRTRRLIAAEPLASARASAPPPPTRKAPGSSPSLRTAVVPALLERHVEHEIAALEPRAAPTRRRRPPARPASAPIRRSRAGAGTDRPRPARARAPRAARAMPPRARPSPTGTRPPRRPRRFPDGTGSRAARAGPVRRRAPCRRRGRAASAARRSSSSTLASTSATVTGPGRFTTNPSAPSPWCSAMSTRDPAKFGSVSAGAATRKPGARPEGAGLCMGSPRPPEAGGPPPRSRAPGRAAQLAQRPGEARAHQPPPSGARTSAS